MPVLPDISLTELLLIVGLAAFSGIAGGVAGYGTGALMPLVLVPLVGAEPVVPIIAISSIFTNFSRFAAYFRYADRRRALIVAGALTLAATAVGLLLSVYVGLFGYKESLAVPDAQSSLVIEFTGAALLTALAIFVIAMPTRNGTARAVTRATSAFRA